MKRFLPHLIWISGVLLVFVSLNVSPAVRDGTPEKDLLSETQSEHMVMLSLVGLLLFATGLTWTLVRLFRQRRVAL
ncbi:MAG: hypothetical protein JWQ71_2569 [Pedosphaera sp.]|nr:hypothetical protein [Pedosphaera sp.]